MIIIFQKLENIDNHSINSRNYAKTHPGAGKNDEENRKGSNKFEKIANIFLKIANI